MYSAPLLILLAALTASPVEVRTLDGEARTGELTGLDNESLTLDADDGTHRLPVQDLQEVRLQPLREAATSTQEAAALVRLRDSSRVSAETITATRRQLRITNAELGELALPRNLVVSLRLSPLDSRVVGQWNSLLERAHDRDLVVVRKGDLLDYVDGVVGTITDSSVNLLIEDSPIEIPRERVFGVIYATDAASPATSCRLDLTNGDSLAGQSLTLADAGFQLQLTDGTPLTLPHDLVARIDYSLGKIRYLGDAEPDAVTYPTAVPAYNDYAWAVRRNRNSAGRPLLVGGTAYDRGLWIHSGTTVRYRLGREYRQFRAIMDMDEDIGSDCDPSIGVIIRGDDRVLLQTDLKWNDEAQPIDLDVSGVRDLVIEVTSTDPAGACEHLDLAEARVIR